MRKVVDQKNRESLLHQARVFSMKHLILVFLSCLLIACSAYSSVDESNSEGYLKFGATYYQIFSSLEKSRFLTFYDSDISIPGLGKVKPSIFTGHTSIPLDFCSEDSELICFSNKIFEMAFAIPKDISKGSWSRDGWNYEVVTRFELDGFVRLQIVADSENSEQQRNFVWTNEKGLIVMKFSDEEVFLLEDYSCGFSAPVSCKSELP